MKVSWQDRLLFVAPAEDLVDYSLAERLDGRWMKVSWQDPLLNVGPAEGLLDHSMAAKLDC